MDKWIFLLFFLSFRSGNSFFLRCCCCEGKKNKNCDALLELRVPLAGSLSVQEPAAFLFIREAAVVAAVVQVGGRGGLLLRTPSPPSS